MFDPLFAKPLARRIKRVARVTGRNIFYGAVLTTAAQLSKIGGGFLLLKLIAVYLGPEGMGQIGNFMSVVTILSLIAGGGVVNGVIKYVAALRHEKKELLIFVSSVKIYSFVFSFIIALVGCLLSEKIAFYLFGDSSKYWLIIVLALAQIGFGFTNLVTGVANGLMDTRSYALIQVSGNLLVLPVAWILVSNFHFAGAALSIVLFYLSYALPAYYFYRKSVFFNRTLIFGSLRANASRLSVYTLMACIGAISVPLVEIIVRAQLISGAGLDAAGIWQGSIKLSSAYMGFFTVFLAVYFMPLIVKMEGKKEISSTVVRFIAIVMAVFLIGSSGLYLFRGIFIPLLLSSNFSALEELIQYQLIGDFFRVSSYVVGFIVIARSSLKIYIFGEVAQGLLFMGLSTFFLSQGMALKGVYMAHIIMNMIYFLVSMVGFWVYLNCYLGEKKCS